MLIELTDHPDPDSYLFGLNKDAYKEQIEGKVPEEYFYEVVRNVIDEIEDEIKDKPFSNEVIYAAKEKASERVIAHLQMQGYNVN